MHGFNELNHQLRNAAEHGLYSTVKKSLENGADIDALDPIWGMNALMFAASRGHVEIVELLLDYGANIEATMPQLGQTALMFAATSGHAEVIQLLSRRGANVNTRNNLGEILLNFVVQFNWHPIIEDLLNRGAMINAQNYLGETPLHFAVRRGDIHSIELLLNHGAHIDTCNREGNPPLIMAALFGRQDIVQLLLNREANIHIRNRRGQTILHFTTQRRWDDLTYFSIGQGAEFENMNVDGLPNVGATEFSNILAQGRIEEAEALYHQNIALLNQPNEFGQTPLMRAIVCGQLEAVRWLIANHADVDIASAAGFTALYFSIRMFMAHRHEETQKPYLEIMQDIAAKCLEFDDRSFALITQDPFLDNLLNPGDFVLKPSL